MWVQTFSSHGRPALFARKQADLFHMAIRKRLAQSFTPKSMRCRRCVACALVLFASMQALCCDSLCCHAA